MSDLDFNFSGYDKNPACPNCGDDKCRCQRSCASRLVVADCGAIDLQSGEIINNDYSQFCEPKGITSRSPSFPTTVVEKDYGHLCRTSRLITDQDFALSVTGDICQGDLGTAILLGMGEYAYCPFEFIWIPNACNFNGDLGIFEQQTLVVWGRMIGADVSWELPPKDCQQFTREFQTDSYMWMTNLEARIPNADPLTAAA